MADIQYLNYGDLQIELLALLNNLANQVQDYVNKQSWSNKRKEKFMSAYSDLMNRGIQGASNSTGLWVLNVGGDEPVPLDTMSRKDKEMYQEAAYFIQQQMAALPTKASQEEKPEEDKSKLPLFDNTYFTREFGNYISNNMFGGRKIDTQTDWNSLDERGENGLRGTNKRAEALANMLESYSNSLEEGKYNFEGSPFKDLSDFKTKLNTAVSVLKDGTYDQKDTDALNAIGLRSSDWFNNGSGDTFVTDDGKTYTYGEYYGLVLPALEKTKVEEQALKTKLALLIAYNNKTFIGFKTSSKMHGANPTLLKEKYGDHLTLLLALYGYSLKTLKELTPQELSELHGAYRYLAKNPIDNKTLKILLSMSSGLYRNAAPNRFKKINGINNLVYDTLANQVIQLQNRQQFNNNSNVSEDLFAGVKTLLDILNQYNNNPRGGGVELTNADKRDIAATLLDLTALVSPGIVSGTAAALGAAGTRTWNRISEKGLFDGMLNWDNALDWGTALLGGTPLWGDATSFAKFARGFGKLMTIPALINAWNNVPEAKTAWDKIDKNNLTESLKKLTPADYHALASVLTGVLAGKNYLKGNLAERRVILHSGYTPELINASKGKVRLYLEASGVVRTKVPKGKVENKTNVIKAEVNGEVKELEISPKVKSKIEKESNKAGKSEESRNKAVEKVLKEEKIVGADDKIKVLAPTKKDTTLFGLRLPSRFRSTKDLFGTKTNSSEIDRGLGDFELWLSNRGMWSKFAYGSNRNLRGILNTLGLNNNVKPTLETPKPTETSETNKIPKTELKSLTPEEIKLLKEVTKEYKSILNGTYKHSGNHLSEEPFKAGNFEFETSIIPGTKQGNLDISFNGNVIKNINFKNQEELMKQVALFLKENRTKVESGKRIKAISHKDMGKILLELKRRGVFKQGGTIDKQRIQQYKNFINK